MDESGGARETAIASGKLTAAVVVHGLWMRGASMTRIRTRLQSAGLAVQTFEYASVTQSLGRNAAALSAFIDRVPGRTVHLVGHSLGGVLIRSILGDRNTHTRIGRIVCLGSPLRGSVTAKRVAELPGGRWLIGQSLGDLLERGGYDRWPGDVEVGSIAGRLPYGFGRLFGRFREPNDGTVAVSETTLPGEREHIVLPVSHVALLWSKSVAAQVEAFLLHGRFLRAQR